MLKSRLPEIILGLRPKLALAEEAGAELIAEAARERVPVESGRLKDAIHVERQPEGVYVVAGDDKAWYGFLVEHGSAEGQRPHPFLVPAFEEETADAVALAAAALRSL